MDYTERTAAQIEDARRDALETTEAPDHELIRLDAAANPQRSYREHVAASRAIMGEQYREDLRRIQRRELEADE